MSTLNRRHDPVGIGLLPHFLRLEHSREVVERLPVPGQVKLHGRVPPPAKFARKATCNYSWLQAIGPTHGLGMNSRS